jgi:hypothetical protein
MPKEPVPATIASRLTSEQRAILACTAIGVSHTAISITDRVMQVMVVRGLIDPKGNRYVLTEAGQAVFNILLERNGPERIGVEVGGFGDTARGRAGG